jgi:hypothetical protein
VEREGGCADGERAGAGKGADSPAEAGSTERGESEATGMTTGDDKS